MIELTKYLKDNYERWNSYLLWLIEHVGPLKLNKLNITQGDGWIIVRKIHDGESYYQFKLYCDDLSHEVMFKLACL
jgi:hypothetical protein